MFENSTVNIDELCNSCEDMACCSSECVLTFLYAGHNIQCVNEQFVSCIHFFLYTSLFIEPHKQKSNGVKSGDLGGQLMVLPQPIHLLGESVTEMLHHMSGIMRRGSVMLEVHSNPCSQRNIL